MGRRVHDSHAEPLARRGLLRWLHLQIRAVLDKEAADAASDKREASTASGVESMVEHPIETSTPWSCSAGSVVLERAPPMALADGDPSLEFPQTQNLVPASAPFRLRPGAALHLYCSSCPCGNASLRRWAQAGKGGDASLGPEAEALPTHVWPEEPHPKLSMHALREGQVLQFPFVLFKLYTVWCSIVSVSSFGD